MFAIIETGGKQYKAIVGEILEIEKLELEEGESITINEVLPIDNDGDVKVGTPFIKGSQVTLKVVDQIKGDKIKVYKMKAKKRYQKTQGHRQKYTLVEVTEIK